MVVATMRVMPNWRSGASDMVSTMGEQFGLVTICPLHPRRRGFGRRPAQMPFGGFGITLAGGAFARAQPGEIEPRMTVEKPDEMLAHHAGGAEYAGFDSVHCFCNCLTILW